MERKVVLKWLKIFSVAFFILSVVELLDLILFSTLINLNLSIYISTRGAWTIHAMLLWIFLVSVICGFIVLSYSIFKVAKKDAIENQTLSKFLLLIGLFLIIGGFIKTNIIVLLGNNSIIVGIIDITLQDALYNPAITPIFGAIMWNYFTVVVGCFLVSGLIFGGVGLKWMLLIQEEEKPDNNT